jgi:putative ABC transport system permease protein
VQIIASLADWFHELRARKGRTLSTVAGIAWGTFGVVGIMAFGRGLEDLMRERAQGIGAGLVVLWGQQTTLPFAGFPAGRRIVFTEEDVFAISKVPGVDLVSPEAVRWETVARGESLLTLPISGIHPRYAELRNVRVAPGGRFINERDLAEERRVAFLGDAVSRNLFGEESAVGRTVIFLGAPFTVVGVMLPKLQDSDYEGQDEDRVCIPLSTFQKITGGRYVGYFTFRAEDPDRTEEMIAAVFETLGRRLRFDPRDRDAFRMFDTTEGDRIRNVAFLAMDSMITLACLFTLAVGGIGVGNLMFLLVRRRTREIGIRMALGARPRWILQEVLLQAMILVTVGGAAGFLGAWALSAGIALSPAAESLGTPRISGTTATLTIVLLGVIGVLAGWFPARRASRLDPVRALAE